MLQLNLYFQSLRIIWYTMYTKYFLGSERMDFPFIGIHRTYSKQNEINVYLRIYKVVSGCLSIYTLLTKIATAQNEAALSYHTVRGLYFLAAIFAASIEVWQKERQSA